MGKVPEDRLKDLVGRAKVGDKPAFGRLYRLCFNDIYDYVIRRVGNRTDAEDLTMEVFTRGFEAIGGYEERGCSIRAWFYRIAHNAVVDHFRTLRKDVKLEELPEIVDDTGTIEERIAHRESMGELYGEIRKLPTAQAEVLVLRFIEDLSVSETAMILDKKEVTVRALQFKGIKNLRQQIDEKGGAQTPEEG